MKTQKVNHRKLKSLGVGHKSNKEWATKLRIVRAILGVGQAQIANYWGINYSTVSLYEDGKRNVQEKYKGFIESVIRTYFEQNYLK